MTVAQLPGHRVHAMTGRYAHLTAELRKRAIEKLPNMAKPARHPKGPAMCRDDQTGSKKAM